MKNCQSCGRESGSPLCSRCERDVNALIRQGLSASSVAARSCPQCKGDGSLLTKVQSRDGLRYGKLVIREERRRCPMCHGLGHLPASLPPGTDVEIAALEIGLERRLLDWRPLNKIGGIIGLPRFSGKAFATNGVLVAIRRDNGKVVIGHLDSFEEVREPKAREHRETKLMKLMKEFA